MDRMRAVVCVEHGPPESLVLKDLPVQPPKPGELQVRLRYAGVNFPDGLVIAGRHQNKRALPFVPGVEGAGIVEAVGEDVCGIAPGDRVVVYTTLGTFAERVNAPLENVVKISERVDLAEAAAFSSTYGTTHHAFRQRATLQAGEWVLVLGAGGGTGLAAVELAKVMGAKVVAAASSEAKLARAREAGADVTVNYREEDLRDALRAALETGTVDVVYDPVGGALSEPAFRSLAWNGRHLVIGFAAGEIPSLRLNLPLLKGAAAVGVFWGDFIRKEPEAHRQNLVELFGWLEEGRLKPHIGARYPLEEAAAAIRHVLDGKAIGKIVLEIER